MSLLRMACGAALTVVLVGCTPQQPAVTPTSSSTVATPAPSPTCSPYDSAPRPCTPEEYAENREQNELIAQAEQVYRKYWSENVRLYRVGGTQSATQPLIDTLIGEALRSSLEVYRDLKANKTKAEGGSFDIVSLAPQPTRTRDGSVMSLTVCWRTRNVKYRLGGKTITRNATVSEDLYFRMLDDALRIFQVESEKVSKC